MTIHDIYQAQRSYFASGATRPLSFRKTQLKELRKAIKRHENEILAALHADMRKAPVEAYGSEIGLLYEEIDHTLAHLRQWMKPVPVSSPLMHYPSGSVIYREPKGLTLLIGPWNYPFQLLINPLIGAIAAGNCAILKPSELAPATEAVIRKVIADAFKPELVAVVTGEGHVVIPGLMQHRFDHIFFTGSIPVGKKILEMAAPHLSPVTLELGGKSPCIVDERADLKTAAKRIIWGKCWNAGQTCIAPDYVLAHEKVADRLMEHMKSAIHQFFGENPANSPDYPRMINEKRFDQVASYLQQGKVFTGGQTERSDKYIAPTILTDVSFESPVMKEEIFGPVLPVIPYKTTAEAIGMIAQNPYPLALYVFSSSRRTEQAFIEKVAFGGGCINNTLVHFANIELPFGGVGYSGMGRYHGRNSFNEFTHEKGVLKTATWLDVPMKYPPFNNKLKLLKMIQK
ncbi:aldehyde dehydrogenase [Chitinophaga sp. GCM10012297]|uniref:Aldehyde dehydrogenase n=1 Tax=Chitinophaga chungangae TaxID=2821488 RepID=A0ABS3YD82_9BACT|nr:aldehyde dehydrogenase [Chitinophaga chungangae]MBO9152640.1 aldehyde dehydrogenase [Chitinophaga chungangae]